MAKRFPRTRKVIGVILFVVGAVRTFSFFILDILDRYKSIRELLDYREKLPDFEKSNLFGPVVCLAGVAILTAPLWFPTARKLAGEKDEERTPNPQFSSAPATPTRPELDVDIQEAQVFIENEFLNKDRKTWLLGPRLLVKLHIVNKNPVPTTVKQIRATFAPQVKTFNVVPEATVEPIRSEVTSGLDTKIERLEDLRALLANQRLDQGNGKQGWLLFKIEETESSRVYFDRGQLTLKIVDSFGNEYAQSVDVPHNQSTTLVIMANGKPKHPQMTAA